MKLYHGTSAKALDAILTGGLQPRGKRVGNFEHTIESCPDAAYLTDTYPVYFAACAANASDDPVGAIIEVETDTLDGSLLNADEDVLEQCGRKKDGLPAHWDIHRRTLHYRDQLFANRWAWQDSLSAMGTCCYLGSVRPSSITRAVVIDFIKQPILYMHAINASISVLNYRFCSAEYRRMTAWVFGDELPPVADTEVWLQMTGVPAYMKSRDGIEFAL